MSYRGTETLSSRNRNAFPRAIPGEALIPVNSIMRREYSGIQWACQIDRSLKEEMAAKKGSRITFRPPRGTAGWGSSSGSASRPSSSRSASPRGTAEGRLLAAGRKTRRSRRRRSTAPKVTVAPLTDAERHPKDRPAAPTAPTAPADDRGAAGEPRREEPGRSQPEQARRPQGTAVFRLGGLRGKDPAQERDPSHPCQRLAAARHPGSPAEGTVRAGAESRAWSP